jgi:hypothetical protein
VLDNSHDNAYHEHSCHNQDNYYSASYQAPAKKDGNPQRYQEEQKVGNSNTATPVTTPMIRSTEIVNLA